MAVQILLFYIVFISFIHIVLDTQDVTKRFTIVYMYDSTDITTYF